MSTPTSQTSSESDAWNAFFEDAYMAAQQPPVANAAVEIRRGFSKSSQVPVVFNQSGHASCAWVASLRNTFGLYARAEADRLPVSWPKRSALKLLSHAAEQLLIHGGLKGGIFWSNWLFATNLYGQELSTPEILVERERLLRIAPDQAFVVRSLTPALHSQQLIELSNAGFFLLPTRQIWLLNSPWDGKWERRRDSQHDLKLADELSASLEWVEGDEFSQSDLARARDLYNHLYLQRYPLHNPAFSLPFFKAALRSPLFKFYGLRQKGAKSLDGFIGIMAKGNYTCTPFLGYDLELPRSRGLYRLLTLQVTRHCQRSLLHLHASAGAGAFKQSRGAERHLEFCAVSTAHLPPSHRANFEALQLLCNRFALPFMQNHVL